MPDITSGLSKDEIRELDRDGLPVGTLFVEELDMYTNAETVQLNRIIYIENEKIWRVERQRPGEPPLEHPDY